MAFEIDPSIKKTLREDGVAKLPAWLDADALARLETLFEWSVANPGPNVTAYDGDGASFRTDNFCPEGRPLYHEAIRAPGKGDPGGMLRSYSDADLKRTLNLLP